MNKRQLWILFRKEWRQLTASKSAMATSVLVPIFLLGIIPQIMGAAVAHPNPAKNGQLPQALNIGLFHEIDQDPKRLPVALLPLFVCVVGLVLPSMMATHLLINEREQRTLELLVALPVRIEQVLKAKLFAVLAATLCFTVPILAVDMVVLPLRGAARVQDLIALPLLLACVLAYSTSVALLLGVLARDFRTANNIGGAILAPSIIVTMALGMLLPGGSIRMLGMGAVYLIAAAVAARIALRTATFERLLR